MFKTLLFSLSSLSLVSLSVCLSSVRAGGTAWCGEKDGDDDDDDDENDDGVSSSSSSSSSSSFETSFSLSKRRE